MEDQEIITLLGSRSEQAIVELSHKYGEICRKISFHILNDVRDVEECLNDTWLGVWNSIPPNHPDSLTAYICRMIRNVSLKKFRYNTAQKRNSYYDAALSELEQCIPAKSKGIENDAEEDLGLLIEQFLNSLSQPDRVMFMKRYWFAKSVSDIAGEFGISENHAAVKMLRIRNRMRKFLENEGVVL